MFHLRCAPLYVQLMLDILLKIFDEMHISFVELVTVLRINASYLLNGPTWTTKIKRRPRPGPQKMVNFNPSQARISRLGTCNSRLQNTIELLLQNTIMITQNVTLSYAQEGRIQLRYTILIF